MKSVNILLKKYFRRRIIRFITNVKKLFVALQSLYREVIISMLRKRINDLFSGSIH